MTGGYRMSGVSQQQQIQQQQQQMQQMQQQKEMQLQQQRRSGMPVPGLNMNRNSIFQLTQIHKMYMEWVVKAAEIIIQ